MPTSFVFGQITFSLFIYLTQCNEIFLYKQVKHGKYFWISAREWHFAILINKIEEHSYVTASSKAYFNMEKYVKKEWIGEQNERLIICCYKQAYLSSNIFSNILY